MEKANPDRNEYSKHYLWPRDRAAYSPLSSSGNPIKCRHVYKKGLDPGRSQIPEYILEDSLPQTCFMNDESPTENFTELWI